MYIHATLLTPPFAILTYAIPSWWPSPHMDFFVPGLRIAVPLGKTLRTAVIVACNEDVDCPTQQIKSLSFPLETAPVLDAGYLCMAEHLSVRQSRPLGNILSHVLPAALRTQAVRVRHFPHHILADDAQKKPRIWNLKNLLVAPEDVQSAIASGIFSGNTDILPPRSDPAEGEICVLHVDPPWPVRPQATRQIAVLEYLFDHGSKGSVNRRQLTRALGTQSIPALESLVKHGYVHVRPQALCQTVEMSDASHMTDMHLLPPAEECSFTHSPAQKNALAAFAKALDSCDSTGMVQSHVLYGVTGSGKTAVYLALAQLCQERGRSMLLLAPEVALALKLKRDADLALAHLSSHMPVYLYHGYQSGKQRHELFCHMAERKRKNSPPCLIIGTRSALFLPLPRLGAIVLDEEHDASYKQDEKFVYHAKEVAWFHASRHMALLVLASATPDIKTFYAAQCGHMLMHTLPTRVGGGTLPEIRLVNIGGQRHGESILAPESEQALKETVARGEQAVILLNRRGYAPTMYCLSCNKVARCPHCAIGLTYHKGREKLICHYCGYTAVFPTVCSHCKGLHYLPMGQGTEKLAEYLATLVAPYKVLRLDKDSVTREGHMERILDSFARQEAHVLVGTQMLSKGHHFPHVTLALVPDGDMGLNTPDYRATERTFQLLVQSAGRAGRGKKAGRVIIQTRDVNHYCWKYIQETDFEGFYEEEIARREKRLYPPFTHLALIRISYAMDWEEGAKAIGTLGSELRRMGRQHHVRVLGPAPAPIAILRGQKRFHCLLKGDDWAALRHIYAYASTLITSLGFKHNDKKNIRLFLDIDPVNML